MDNKLSQRMRKHITDSEGTEFAPYKDTKGKLTVGTGFLVDDEKSFVAIPFEILDPHSGELRAATEAEKKAEFKRARGLSNKELQSDKGRSPLSLPESENRRRLDAEINTRIGKIKGEIGEADWNKLTDGQKTAVLDIHYANGSLKNFPSLKQAIKDGDAKAMAEQSDFHGGKIGDTGFKHRNFGRIRRNRAAMLGIDPESPEAYRAVADKYPNHPSLKDEYKKHGSPGGGGAKSVQARQGAKTSAPANGGATIQPGDTLSKIAARHGVSVADLAKVNGITDPNHIRTGQSLVIPGQFPSPEAIERRILSGAVKPPGGPVNAPWPTRSEWPKVDPAVFSGAQPPQGLPSDPALQAPEAQLLSGPERDHGKEGVDWAALGQKGLDIAKELVGIKSAAAAEITTEQKAPIDRRATAIAERAATPLANPGEAALVKPVEAWTEGEMKDVLGHAQAGFRGWRSGDTQKALAYEKVQDWHTHVYGDDEQTYDGGKPVEPVARVVLPEQPTPPRTPQGEDLYQASGRIGQRVADAAGLDGVVDAVKGLQRGLNMLGRQPMPKRSEAWGPYTRQAPLLEDGQYGPRTDFALKNAVGRFGTSKVENALALGRFNTFARDAQKTGNVDGLETRTHAVFGPLFRDPSDAKAPKVEAGVLQETLNGLGADLKVDHWIGPKTTAAFGRVLQDEDADSFTSAFGKGLGLA